MTVRFMRTGVRFSAALALLASTFCAAESFAAQTEAAPPPLLIKSKFLFDGIKFVAGQGMAVLIQNGRIAKVGAASTIVPPAGTRTIDIPNGAILPGIIDMHTHHLVNAVPVVRIMEHGVTTARDLGGGLTPIDTGKPFKLRQILSGPIIQAVGGYPNIVFPGSGVAISGAAAATAKVQQLVAQGSKIIAVSLEPGGELGAPWTAHNPTTPPPWPTLTNAELQAIVTEAHRLGKRVVAYAGETGGVRRAFDFGVDEWAHIPCDHVDHDLWSRVAVKTLVVNGTMDTLVSCDFSAHNAGHVVEVGAKLYYATDLGHVDIPHGADARELEHIAKAWMSVGRPWPTAAQFALASATGLPGRTLYNNKETTEPNLGRLVVGAPADIIVTGENPVASLKTVEYPRLVVSGGHVVIQRAVGQ